VLTDGTVSKLKKTILISYAILCLLSVLFLKNHGISAKASSMIWIVDDDELADFRTIQEAINNASSGDTIFVRSGIYFESILVIRTVSLIGENRNTTIIDGSGAGSVISIAASGVNIQGFTVRNSGDRLYESGIFIDRRSSGNNISHNIVSNNNDGISLYSSSNNIVSSNIISNNDYNGIVLYSSSNNKFSANTVSNNSDGISLFSSRNNVFSGNTISNNNNGIYPIFGSISNIIYHNNFNNIQNVQTDSVNFWNSGDEGNYWSDYYGKDSDNDGIGDTKPYIIDSSNQDDNPLMGLFSELNVALETETYSVTIICNSTISDLTFEIGQETGNRLIRFNIGGEDGTVGFCRVTIPAGLMKYPSIVLAGSNEILPARLNDPNETYVRLYFTYSHKSHTIAIVSSEMMYLYSKLEIYLSNLNTTYYSLLSSYNVLSANYSLLQENFGTLSASYDRHLSDYSDQIQNIRSLVYIFAATTAIFMITTVYLSKIAHASITAKTKESMEK